MVACNLEIEKLPEFDNHKSVTFFHDKPSGLKAFVVIHNDNLGAAIGGTRMWAYATTIEGLQDALNLSRAMTYKCAMAGVRFGGGKGVIIGNPSTEKTTNLLTAYAAKVKDYFGPRFRTGTDVGLTDDDVKMMSAANPFLVGVMEGDKLSTSHMATLGVFYSIKGCFEEANGGDGLSGKRFAIKGLGKTGMELLRLLTEEGAEVVAAEIDTDKVKYAKKHFPKVKIVKPEVIHKQKVDMYCPCALGGDLNKKTIKELDCKFVVGTANNQLSDNEIGDKLWKMGIIYAPDYVANGGGLINVADELEPDGYRKERVLARVRAIKETIQRIISRSKKSNQTTHRIADRMAEEIFLGK